MTRRALIIEDNPDIRRLLEATLMNEPIGEGDPSLLYTTFKSPDYTGHVYGMQSKWEGLMLQAVPAPDPRDTGRSKVIDGMRVIPLDHLQRALVQLDMDKASHDRHAEGASVPGWF